MFIGIINRTAIHHGPVSVPEVLLHTEQAHAHTYTDRETTTSTWDAGSFTLFAVYVSEMVKMLVNLVGTFFILTLGFGRQ